MRISYYGPLKEAAGNLTDESLSGATCLGNLLDQLKTRHANTHFAHILDSCAIAVNDTYVDNTNFSLELTESDDIAFIPPVSAG